ncbi:MAG: hypothetical protein AAGD11_12390 [Planctomycetota bacterium]
MSLLTLKNVATSLALLLMLSFASEAWANPNTGPPVNLHRRFVVQQTKRRAAQGLSTRRHVGVWLSGGYNRTVRNARTSGRRWRRR